MRSAVDFLIRYQESLSHPGRALKLEKISSNAFDFARGSFALFAWDQRHGAFRDWPLAEPAGRIVGDLHNENFGTFRALTGDIVYDIDDFDDSTTAQYEFDLRRLASTLLLAAHENGLSISSGVTAVEEMLIEYLSTVSRLGSKRKRLALALSDPKSVRRVLRIAGEKKRVDMIRRLVRETMPGMFEFRPSENYVRGDDRLRHRILQALPVYLKNALAPEGADPTRYSFHDVAFRFAGNGSLGRQRYALLLGKGGDTKTGKRKPDTLATLRLIEWKESLVSGLDHPLPRRAPDRAKHVIETTTAMQLVPKRYLGHATLGNVSMQGREIGANDRRFRRAEFLEPARFTAAARVFGSIAARAHLLGSLKEDGPRPLAQLGGRFVLRVIAFATAYAEQTLEDFEELTRRRGELQRLWRER